MKVFEQEVLVNGWLKTGSPLENLQKAVTEACGRKAAPIRVAMVGKNRLGHACEMEAIAGVDRRLEAAPVAASSTSAAARASGPARSTP